MLGAFRGPQRALGHRGFATGSEVESTRDEESTELRDADAAEDGVVKAAVESVTSSVSEAASSLADTVSETASRVTSLGSSDNQDPNGFPDQSPSTDIYLGNLLFDITAEDLKREFAQFGPINRAVIATDPRGLSKGFGYLSFETVQQATEAVASKHMSTFQGRRMVVRFQNSNNRRNTIRNPPGKTLFIGNLAFEMSDADLHKLFREVRNVLDVRVAVDRRTGQPRGFAHADFLDVASAEEALKALQGREVFGRQLRIDYSGVRPDHGSRNAPS